MEHTDQFGTSGNHIGLGTAWCHQENGIGARKGDGGYFLRAEILQVSNLICLITRVAIHVTGFTTPPTGPDLINEMIFTV